MKEVIHTINGILVLGILFIIMVTIWYGAGNPWSAIVVGCAYVIPGTYLGMTNAKKIDDYYDSKKDTQNKE